LPASFVAVTPESSAGLRNQFGAAALDEIAGFGNDVLQYIDQFGPRFRDKTALSKSSRRPQDLRT
jgi:hypothetical protein